MSDAVNTQVRPSYRLLTDQQIQEIHRASLEVLETAGVRVLHPEGVQLLQEAGCRVKDGNRVQMPNWLVEEAIRSSPSRVTIYDRLGDEAMRLEGRNIHFGMGTDLISTVDLETGATRPSVLQDVANAARVADYCETIDFIASYALPSDVSTNTMYVHCVKTQLENSSKPIFFTAAGREDLAIIIEMAAAVRGGEQALEERPFLIHYSEPTPPLTHSYGAVNKLFLCAEKGVPLCYAPAAMHGGSAPVTLAGGLVQTNAEALSGIVLHQLKRKGAPVISGLALPVMDMQTFAISYSAPELRLSNSAFADLYHHYRIPCWSTTGSDAHRLDEQAAMEHAVSSLMAALDGANLIHDVGYLGQGLLGNPAALVMCDEISSYVKRIMRGFEMGRGQMALDVIRRVGPGGDYLAERHTVNHFREELWQPWFLNRDNPETWEQKGSLSYVERVTQKTREILKTHQPQPLSEEVTAILEEIASRAEPGLSDVQFTA